MVGATLLLAWSVTTAAQQQAPAHDGVWWRQQSSAFKAGYMLGFMEGHQAGVHALVASVHGDAETVQFYDKQTRLYADVTNGQLVAGMDTVYRDFRNLTIPVSQALFVVLRSLRGQLTDREAEDFLRFMRWEQAGEQGPPPPLTTTGVDR
jgi:hypothetical protein